MIHALKILATTVFMALTTYSFALGKNVPGFLFPIGGGASVGTNNVLKPAHVQIHAAALNQLKRNQANGATAGSYACAIEYHSAEIPDTTAQLQVVKDLFVAAGLGEDQVKTFVFDSRSKSDDTAVMNSFAQDCGIVFVPGGNQTEMRSLWQNTTFEQALRKILSNGGGLMGKSAGAAIQGTIGYFPSADSETTPGDLLRSTSLAKNELTKGMFSKVLPGITDFYVETHVSDRERTARALAMLAAWNSANGESIANGESGTSKFAALGIAVDSDTGALISFDSSIGEWVASVHGARAVEFITPNADSYIGLTPSHQPIYTNATSNLLISGSKITLSGNNAGQVILSQSRAWTPAAPQIPEASKHTCYNNIPSQISDNSHNEERQQSEVFFFARNIQSGKIGLMDDVEYAYLSGDLIPQKGTGCGYWQTHAFDPDAGKVENRLNAQRFALGAKLTNFSVAMPATMSANFDTFSGIVSFQPSRSANGSSVLIYDARFATERGVAKYIYKELGYQKPVQTGAWISAKVHLLPPGGTYIPATGEVSQ